MEGVHTVHIAYLVSPHRPAEQSMAQEARQCEHESRAAFFSTFSEPEEGAEPLSPSWISAHWSPDSGYTEIGLPMGRSIRIVGAARGLWIGNDYMHQAQVLHFQCICAQCERSREMADAARNASPSLTQRLRHWQWDDSPVAGDINPAFTAGSRDGSESGHSLTPRRQPSARQGQGTRRRLGVWALQFLFALLLALMCHRVLSSFQSVGR
jgi:hypothetical protein